MHKDYPKKFPPMTIDKREGKSHGLRSPLVEGSPEYIEQVQDAIYIAADAPKGMTERLVKVLDKYCPVEHEVTYQEMIDDINTCWVYKIDSYKDIGKLVLNDECLDMFSLMVKIAKQKGLKSTTQKDVFIKGDGVARYRRALDSQERTLDKVFDEKYLREQKRILVWLFEKTGIDFTPFVDDKVHPGHFTWPAGHDGKGSEAVDQLAREFELNDYWRRYFIKFKHMLVMARCVFLIHKPEDNCASGYLAGLPEFKSYGE